MKMKKITLLFGMLIITALGVHAQCVSPSAPTITDLTPTAAILNWEEVTTGDDVMFYQICFVAGTGEAVPGPTTTDLFKESYEPFIPGSTYSGYVRSFCEGVWSDWSAPVTFTTPMCESVSPPYNLNFESVTIPGLPECTSTVNAGSGNNWVTAANPGSGFTSNVLQYTGNTEDANAWFFTKGVQLTGGTYYKISYKYGNNSTTTTENFRVTINSSPNPISFIANFAVPTDVTGGTQATNSTDFFTFGPPGETNTYFFGFNVLSEGGQGNLYIDDFIIEPLECGYPSNVSATNITTSSATISWEPPTTGNSGTISIYHYAVTTSATPPAEFGFHPGPSLTISDLDPGTTYFIHTRTLCGPVTGDWSEPVAFVTPACEFTTVPYTQDFESAEVPGIPDCTTVFNIQEGGDWITSNNPGSGFTNKTLHYTSNSSAADSWFFTQGIQLTAGTVYKVAYKYGNNNTTTAQNLKVVYGTNPSPAFITDEIAVHNNIQEGEAQDFANTFFTVEEDGIYYFGFNSFSEGTEGSLYVDDIRIEETVCGTPINLEADDLTHETATITWEASDNGNVPVASGYQYVVSTVNEEPTGEGTTDDGFTLNLEELDAETTYYVFIRSQCGELWSEWEMVTFTTDEEPVCGTPINLEADDITHETATITWEASDNGNIPSIGYQYVVSIVNEEPTGEGTTDDGFILNLDELDPETTYYVFIRSQCDEVGSDWEMITFTTEEEPVNGIADSSFKGFKYYPNPANDILQLSSVSNIDNVEVYTITGQLVLQQSVNNTEVQLNISKLQAGAYFLIAYSGNETKKIKVIKQ